MGLAKNRAMREPWMCPHDGSALVLDGSSVEAAPVAPRDAFGLLVLAADVSVHDVSPRRRKNVDQTRSVAAGLAATLRGLALPTASTAGNLLVGIVAFAERAAWLDVCEPDGRVLGHARVTLVSELVEHGPG